jgi:hypothetical protein
LGRRPGWQDDDYTPEKNGAVLSFIEQRLQNRQAAGAGKLRNSSTRPCGVEKGFTEARKILDGMGVLQRRVWRVISTPPTRNQVGLVT